MRLEGEVAIITGGNSGIGRAAAEAMAREGAAVVVAARNKKLGDETVASIRASGVRRDGRDPRGASAPHGE